LNFVSSRKIKLPHITANNIQLYYEDNGPANAPVILLIMGLGTQMIAWPDAMIQGLVARGFRVIHYDNRDVGMSQRMEDAPVGNMMWAFLANTVGLPVRSAYTVADMAKDGIGLLDALCIRSAHVVGASMGGMIVQHMAANHSDKVMSLTSIMSTSGKRGLPGPRSDIRKAMMRPRPANPTREEAVAAGAEVVKAFSYPDPARPDSAYPELVGRAFDRGYYPVGTVRQLLAIVADGSRVDMLKTIKAPTLVIHGGADPLVPKEGGIDTAKHIPRARLEIIEEMAHDLPPSQIGRMVDLIAGHAANAA
jgi:pimeloyl-ACP methyl ester carboxylesterase